MTERESNRLFERVDALMRRQQQEAQQEVPVLTEMVEPDLSAAAPPEDARGDTLAADIERGLIARLAPELERRFAGLRAALEKEMRRAVREAVAHALAARAKAPPRD
jgi:hypothetical protein